ncbi:hypothetical protein MKS88_001573 [Plasmodium brasilianum]|uniref:Uncharacterized protein n=1 Tax=Plasmodium brasilianum TaxID=5824 RepID=A0ACB9YD20_PLABR|nr:hypothetical protein MKS88_001573 [Plasmodium brasilianum]
MEYKIMFLFIKISVFILLPWICHINHDMNPLNKNLDKRHKSCGKLNTLYYRFLAKYKREKDSYIANFKDEMPHKVMKEKQCISNNKKGTDGKYNYSYRSSLYIEEYGKNAKKNKYGISKTEKYCDIEKKIFKELDYKDYLKNVKIIEDKEYKNLSRKKSRIRISLLLLFLLILILPILDLSLENIRKDGLLGLLGLLNTTNRTVGGISTIDVEGGLITLLNIGEWGASKAIPLSIILFYCLPFFIFVIIFIIVMVYYYKKVIKYENIKFRKKINKK